MWFQGAAERLRCGGGGGGGRTLPPDEARRQGLVVAAVRPRADRGADDGGRPHLRPGPGHPLRAGQLLADHQPGAQARQRAPAPLSASHVLGLPAPGLTLVIVEAGY